MKLAQYILNEFSKNRISEQEAKKYFEEFLSNRTLNSFDHPMLHENTSDLSEQRFTSTFNGDEFFLNDHRIKGEKYLPGVGYLEMARAAVEKAVALPESVHSNSASRLCLKNVVWSQPFVMGNSESEINIALFDEHIDGNLGQEIGSIHYEIYSESAAEDELQIYSQGIAEYRIVEKESQLDIPALQHQMNHGTVSAEQCYNTFKNMGISYGPSHQGITELYIGQDQLLAKLTLPESVQESLNDYVLHPSIMDSAVQSAIGFALDPMKLKVGEEPKVPLIIPFALDLLEIIGACTTKMFVWVRGSEGSALGTEIQSLDIDLYDEDGNMCVKMRGFSARILEGELRLSPPKESISTLQLSPIWQQQSISAESAQIEFTEHVILLCELPLCVEQKRTPIELEAALTGSQCLALRSSHTTIDNRFTEYALRCFELIKEMLNNKSNDKVLMQIVVPNTGESVLFSGLSGLLKTAMLENTKFIGQLIQVDASASLGYLVSLLEENKTVNDQPIIKYENKQRFVLILNDVESTNTNTGVAFKDDGVYLITGGLGGLGQLFTQEILAQTKNAKIILTGRSVLSEEKQITLSDLNAQTAQVVYHAIDVSNLKQVCSLIETIDSDYGKLNGVIHSAGVIADNFILNKTEDEFRQVLSSKVTGTFNLDTAIQNKALDFMVLFSSISGTFGNSGQADYAAANGFIDQFAHYRQELTASGERQGQTISINWPLWKEGGMQIDQASEAMMTASTGMVSMTTETGLQTFYQGLSSGKNQWLVMQGYPTKMRTTLQHTYSGIVEKLDQAASVQEAPMNSESRPDDQCLEEKTAVFLKKQLGAVLKLSFNKIDIDAPLEKYGMDSILVMSLTNQLEKTFGSLSKTIFFEHQTLAELAEYLAQSYKDVLNALFKHDDTQVNVADPAVLNTVETTSNARLTLNTSAQPERALNSSSRKMRRRRFSGIQLAPSTNLPLLQSATVEIAIIGLSGRYPQAVDLQAYWDNLQSGRDCITEVPMDRWDWREYYSEDRNKAGHHFSKYGGFIDGVDEFDPLFFNISPRDAMIMDPQERLFLEHAWMAIEDAGYTREQLQLMQAQASEGQKMPGQIGVYTGVMYGEYQLFGVEESLKGNRMGFSGSLASIANRVSYALNLQGPSITTDSMCSSSLTSIHLACQDLKHGRTDLAIAGGVNVTIHPNKYLMLSAGQFISTKGHCESFGEGGDGYIPAEGVGTVMLKRLKDAQRDGDHIYGTILGSAINHGGKTNGYSVPNPKAQRDVIERALLEANTDPSWVSYIEAHGTGTKLGDPIEITALTQVFGKSHENGDCLIGSVKSNIGHGEGAAGISGLSKVLLQMKHQQIVPSLHSETLNPNINFENTPFVVNQKLRAWDRITKDGKEIPRIAGVSSFGAGGSNAHIVIKEYQIDEDASNKMAQANPSGVMIPLSARTAKQLEESASRLLAFIQDYSKNQINAQTETSTPLPPLDLSNLAYTLQVGREAMEERMGFIVTSLEDLEQKLKGFVSGNVDVDNYYRGQVKSNKETLSVMTKDSEFQEMLEKWLARNKYSKLLDLWVKGLVFDWNKLYLIAKPNRISLPTYPFAKDRYWIPITESSVMPMTISSQQSSLHPLLHENTSDLMEQRFTTTFSGQEFFLNDHQVQGEKVLPGVSYLEMARAAVEKVFGRSEDAVSNQAKILSLKNVIWSQPFVVDDSDRTINIALFDEDLNEKNDSIHYEIYSEIEVDDEMVVHSQGLAQFKTAQTVAQLDIAGLQAQMDQGTLSAQQCYQAFNEMGLNYGPGHQGITEIYQGEGHILAKLTLPDSVQHSESNYVLHPSLMDSALQAAIGLTLTASMLEEKNDSPKKLIIPFSLESIDIIRACTSNMYAWVRHTKVSTAISKIQKLDIDLCDQQGNVCAQLKGFTSRILDGDLTTTATKNPNATTIKLSPVWQEQLVMAASTRKMFSEHLIILCELPLCEQKKRTPIELESLLTGSHCLALRSNETSIATRFTEHAVRCFDLLQERLKSKLQGNLLVQIIVPNVGEEVLFSGLSGLLKTAALENPKITGQLIQVDVDEPLENLITLLQENKNSSAQSIIKYENKKRFVPVWSDVVESEERSEVVFNDQGVYLITGGLGGLGLLFADEILANTKGANIILTGRSELTNEKQTTLDTLNTKTGHVAYQALDVTDAQQVSVMIDSIEREYGTLNGIIHSAGMIDDNFILKKTAAEFRSVMSPKVTGTFNLDHATRDMDLDFIVLFSSLSGAVGNPGQADYAAANGFMDQFSAYRNDLARSGVRKGQTLSVNWPLWEEGGMRIEPAFQQHMFDQTGMKVLPTAQGLEVINKLKQVASHSQLLILHGDRKKIKHVVLKIAAPDNKINDFRPPVDSSNLVSTGSTSMDEYLLSLFADQLKISPEELDAQTEFSEYGVDSILIMSLLNQLEKRFERSFAPTTIMEYSSLEKLAQFLKQEGLNKVLSSLEIPSEIGSSTENMTIKGENTSKASSKKTIRRKQRRFGSSQNSKSTKVAIISQACRLPGANNVEEFWHNLAGGKNSIVDAPQDGRWMPEETYHPDLRAGKTYTNHGGFIQNIECFDANFFGVKDHDAIVMDPQHRIILELSQELFDQAAQSKNKIDGSATSVFIGAKENNYLSNYSHHVPDDATQHMVVNSIANMMAARVSDFHNLKGVSKTIDTACSSSLIAIHDACESILNGSSTMAIAGGIYLMIDAESHVSFSQAKVLSNDGNSYVFDERAQGFVLGEGAGLVLLKEYDAAVRDGDPIQAVILGSAVNNDGRTVGLTVPNQNGQKEVIEAALAKSQIDPSTIGYVEAHGTGTLLGDPIEIRAASQVYRDYTPKKQFCAVGSVKSNVGHTMTAAGVTGLLKVVACLQHKQIPPTLNCEKPHPRFEFESSPFYPNTELQNWKPIEGVRRAAISSFGFGGSNCHMILEEYLPMTVSSYVAKTNFRRNRYWLGQDIVPVEASEEDNSRKIGSLKEYKRRSFAYDLPLLQDHRVSGMPLLVGASYLSMMIETGKDLLNGQDFFLEKILYSSPIVIEENEVAEVVLQGETIGDAINFTAEYSLNPSQPRINVASGVLSLLPKPLSQTVSLSDYIAAATETREGHLYYGDSTQEVYGSSLFSVQKVYTLSDNKVLGMIQLTKSITQELPDYDIHPAIFDACHVISTFSLTQGSADLVINHQMPMMIKKVTVKNDLSAFQNHEYFCIAEKVMRNDQIASMNLQLFSMAGELLCELEGFTTKQLNSSRENGDVETEAQGSATPKKKAPTVPISEASHDISAPLAQYLIKKVASSIGVSESKIQVTQNFMDMGGDSANMVSMVQSLEKELQIALYPTILFEYQNIQEVSQYLLQEFTPDISNFFAINGKTSTQIKLASAKQSLAKTATKTYNTITKQSASTTSTTTRTFSLASSVRGKGDAATDSKTSRFSHKKTQQEMAIIGISGQFADSDNIDEFWQHIDSQTDLLKEVPSSHWDVKPWFDENFGVEDKTYCKWGSFINGVDHFDASFFNISPREAEWIDPQLRMLLQSVYRTGEDAGVINQIRGSDTGVFVGVCFHDYADKIAEMQQPINPLAGTGNGQTIMANRISFLFDLTGPSIAVDTACSSSLFALHQACQAIQNEECKMAFVGGVNLLLSSPHYRYFSSIGALSATGRCHTFDAQADGYVPGECIASILIKPKEQALADGDQIYAVVKGSAALHGGYTPSLTAPSVSGEMNVITKAWKNADIDPSTLSYIEAHGTGTKLGDPIEINALTRAFQKFTPKHSFCAVGSAKANIGHAEGAAGIVGIIKVIQQMKQQVIPAMPKFEKINPYIKLDRSALFINTENIPWTVPEGIPRRAGVSSFGFSGAYAHVVLEEYSHELALPSRISDLQLDQFCIPLSAKNPERLLDVCKNLLTFLESKERKELDSKVDNNLCDDPADARISQEEYQKIVILILAGILNVPNDAIDASQEFSDFGVEPLHQISLLDALRNQCDVELDSSVFIEHCSVEALSEYIVLINEESLSALSSDDTADNTHNPQADIYISDLAFTLQVGREAMGERLGLIVSSIEELKEKLSIYIENNGEEQVQFSGSVKQNKALFDSLDSDEDISQLVDSWMLKGKYLKLIDLWSQGLFIDWNRLYTGIKPKRISLPTYPFAKERYWVPNVKELKTKDPIIHVTDQRFWEVVKSGNVANFAELLGGSSKELNTPLLSMDELLLKLKHYSSGRAEQDVIDSCSYLTVWQRYDHSPDIEMVEGKWLVLSDDSFLARYLILSIQAAGGEVIVVQRTEMASEAMAEAIYSQVNSLVDQAGTLKGMFYLWGLGSPEGESAPTELTLSLYALQAIVKIFRYKPVPCWLLTSQAVSTAQNDKIINPHQAMIKGLGKAFSQEYPDYWGGFLDLPLESDGCSLDSVLPILLGQNGANHHEDSFAMRKDGLYVERLERYTLPVNRAELWTSTGSILITGGLGGLGFNLALELARMGNSHIVLTSRMANPSSKQIEKIKEMESKGCKITVASCDVADQSAMAILLENIKQEGQAVSSVFHAAGVLDDAAFLDHKPSHLQAVLQSKVLGADVLSRLLADEPIDTLVFFSSISGVVGGVGQAAYASANAYLDSLSHSLRSSGIPALSISWGPWNDIGMAVELIKHCESVGISGLHSANALQAMFSALNQDKAHIVFADINWSVYQQHVQSTLYQGLVELKTELPASIVESKNLAIDGLEKLEIKQREDKILAYLSRLFAETLLIDQDSIDPRINIFNEYGVDSIIAMGVLQNIKNDLGIQIYPRELYERATLSSLSKYISEEFTNLHNGGSGTEKKSSRPSGKVRSEKSNLHSPKLKFNDEKSLLSPAAFILSSPRAGSTLLRSMLAGHPQLFSPPELHLLNFQDMAQRNETLNDSYLGEGLQRGFMELYQQNVEESAKKVEQLVRDNSSIKDVYAEILSAMDGRMLVDKSPSYASDLEIIRRAEILFDQPKYIHLVRHPYAMIESFSRMRMEKLIGQGQADGHELAEEIWKRINGNIDQFFAESVSSDRRLLVRYEDLISEPEITLKKICRFLDIEYTGEVLNPYSDGRMTDGIHAQSMSIGDPNFLTRKSIDKNLGKVWETITLPNLLSDDACEIAKTYAYELPAENKTISLKNTMPRHRDSIVTHGNHEYSISEWGDPNHPPIICVHGFLDQGPVWEEMAVELVAKGYRVIAPDLKGHGLSSHAGTENPNNAHDYIDDLDIIIESLTQEQVVLVGHSLGSVISAIYASTRPEKVSAMVMVETIVPGETRVEDVVSKLDQDLSNETHTLEHTVLLNRDVAEKRLQLAMPALTSDRVSMLVKRITKKVEGGYIWTWDPRLRTHKGFASPELNRSNYLDTLSKLSLPTMMINGNTSEHRRESDQHAIDQALSSAECVSLTGGHHVHIESPEATAGHISQFLSDMSEGAQVAQEDLVNE